MFVSLVTILLSTVGFAHADCLKVDTNGLKQFTHQNKTYYIDMKNSYVISMGCLKADASAVQVKLSLQKSGTVEKLNEQRVTHTVKSQGATALTIFDFGAENGQITGVSSKLSPEDLKKTLLQRIKN